MNTYNEIHTFEVMNTSFRHFFGHEHDQKTVFQLNFSDMGYLDHRSWIVDRHNWSCFRFFKCSDFFHENFDKFQHFQSKK